MTDAPPCKHPTKSRIWINRSTGNFRCTDCGFQFFLKELAQQRRQAKNIRRSKRR